VNIYAGEIASLLTSFFWASSSIMFTLAGRAFGSMVVNRVRLVLAAIFLIVMHVILYGTLLPTQASGESWLWMSVSGFVGLVLGDIFLFQAYLWVGPRITMLMMSLAPVIGALTAWLLLGETLGWGEIVGMVITMTGIAWVVADGDGQPKGQKNPHYLRGLLFGLGAATGQAVGLVLSKRGMGADMSPISGNVMRMLAATTSLWAITLLQRQAQVTVDQLRRKPRDILYIVGGAVLGPFLGVSFSLYGVQHANVGIASTLMSLAPVILLPVGYFFFKERFGWAAVIGTLLAVSGVALLFLL
jgi:drug/metabolite transporter (DMT)-like permease